MVNDINGAKKRMGSVFAWKAKGTPLGVEFESPLLRQITEGEPDRRAGYALKALGPHESAVGDRYRPPSSNIL